MGDPHVCKLKTLLGTRCPVLILVGCMSRGLCIPLLPFLRVMRAPAGQSARDGVLVVTQQALKLYVAL